MQGRSKTKKSVYFRVNFKLFDEGSKTWHIRSNDTKRTYCIILRFYYWLMAKYLKSDTTIENYAVSKIPLRQLANPIGKNRIYLARSAISPIFIGNQKCQNRGCIWSWIPATCRWSFKEWSWRGNVAYGFNTSIFSKTSKQKKTENGHVFGCLMFWFPAKEIKKTNKQTNRLLLKHIFEVTHVV